MKCHLGLLTGASVLSLLQVLVCCCQILLPQKRLKERIDAIPIDVENKERIDVKQTDIEKNNNSTSLV